MRLEMRCAIWNFWNLKLFKLLNPSQELVIWNIQIRLDMRCAIWNLKHFNLFKLIMRAAYLKLSDETSNKIFYLKCLKLETSQTCHGSCLFETFRWDSKQDILFEIFETWNFSTHYGELLIWNFQMRLKRRCAI